MNPARVDVRAFTCPITWVKTRMALERLAPGDRLEVWLGDGEPLRNLPRSAEEDGHAVAAVEPLPGEPDGGWRVVLVKGAPPPQLP
jgi:tRNA 2-thiouridine synthesizing protein A